MDHLSYLNKYFYKYRWRFFLGIIFVFISNYFRVLQPQMIRHAMDLVIENINLYQLFNGFDNQAALFALLGETLFFFGALVLVFALLMGVFMYFMRQTIIVMSRLIEYDLRKEMFDQYQKLSLSFYRKNNTGDLMARITEDVTKVRMYLGPAVLYGINLFSLFTMVIYSMLSVSVELTIYSLLPLPFLSISIYYVSNLINKRSEKIQEQLARLNSTAQEVYSGIRVVKSYVQEKPMNLFFKKQSDHYRDNSMELVKINAFFFPLMLLLIGISTVITVYVGGLQVAKGNITPGNIAEFVIYINMLTWPVTAIGWIASIVQQASASQKRINEFLKIEPEISNPIQQIKALKGNIVFDKVSFVYPDSGIKALNEVSFELKAGQRMAIIGKTGAGKTTIADLLVRMYDLSEGSIQLDQEDIRKLDLANLRNKIGYVPQDVFLFSDTVAQNIAFGKKNASLETIQQYAKYAAIYQEIKDLPEGFETMVGERGVTLSGGQKQRISIARSMIKKPDIIILDDCLSAVDTTTEQQILSFMSQELQGKTSIIITHRIYSLLKFDKIIVLEDGAIVEEGTHEDLISKKGYYFELFEKQKIEDTEIKL